MVRDKFFEFEAKISQLQRQGWDSQEMFSKGVVTGTNPMRRERLWRRSLSQVLNAAPISAKQALLGPVPLAPVKWGFSLRFLWKAWESLFRSGVLGLSLMKGGIWGTGLGALDVGGKFPAWAPQAQTEGFEEGECGSCRLSLSPGTGIIQLQAFRAPTSGQEPIMCGEKLGAYNLIFLPLLDSNVVYSKLDLIFSKRVGMSVCSVDRGWLV